MKECDAVENLFIYIGSALRKCDFGMRRPPSSPPSLNRFFIFFFRVFGGHIQQLKSGFFLQIHKMGNLTAIIQIIILCTYIHMYA